MFAQRIRPKSYRHSPTLGRITMTITNRLQHVWVVSMYASCPGVLPTIASLRSYRALVAFPSMRVIGDSVCWMSEALSQTWKIF